MRPLVDEVAAMPESARVACVEGTRGVLAGEEPIGGRFALSPIVVPPARCAEFDRLGRALHIVLRESLGALRRRPALLARIALGPRGISQVHRRFDLGQAQYAAFTVPSFLMAHRLDLPDPIVRARLDAFVVGGALRVIEINVGPMLCRVMDELAAALVGVPEFAALVDGAAPPAASAGLADALIRRHRMRFGDAPTHAAQAHHPSAGSSDAMGLARALEARGVTVLEAGPGDLHHGSSGLLCRGRRVTLLTEECTAIPTTLARFGFAARAAYKLHRLRALRRRSAIVFPAPFESVFNKAYLALLSEGALDGEVDAASLTRVRSALVWTRVTRPGATTTLDGEVHDLMPWAIQHRSELVLKPVVGHTSVGVVLGDLAPEDVWRAAVAGAFEARDCVLQERLRPEPMELLLASGERVRALVDTSPVFVDGRAVAVFSRYSVGGELLHFIGHGADRDAHGLVPVWLRRDAA